MLLAVQVTAMMKLRTAVVCADGPAAAMVGFSLSCVFQSCKVAKTAKQLHEAVAQ